MTDGAAIVSEWPSPPIVRLPNGTSVALERVNVVISYDVPPPPSLQQFPLFDCKNVPDLGESLLDWVTRITSGRRVVAIGRAPVGSPIGAEFDTIALEEAAGVAAISFIFDGNEKRDIVLRLAVGSLPGYEQYASPFDRTVSAASGGAAASGSGTLDPAPAQLKRTLFPSGADAAVVVGVGQGGRAILPLASIETPQMAKHILPTEKQEWLARGILVLPIGAPVDATILTQLAAAKVATSFSFSLDEDDDEEGEDEGDEASGSAVAAVAKDTSTAAQEKEGEAEGEAVALTQEQFSPDGTMGDLIDPATAKTILIGKLHTAHDNHTYFLYAGQYARVGDAEKVAKATLIPIGYECLLSQGGAQFVPLPRV